MPSLLERLQARIELFRLEQRYTRRRNRRSTFVSNAVYIDGEYIYNYNTPSSTGSSGHSGASNAHSSTSGNSSNNRSHAHSSTHVDDVAATKNVINDGGYDLAAAARAAQAAAEEDEQRKRLTKTKRLNRWSSMPGFGSIGKRAGMDVSVSVREHMNDPQQQQQDAWRRRSVEYAR